MARALDRVLFEAVTNQLDARGLVVKTGTLVDATVIPSACVKDEEAHWVAHRRKAPVHGYKAHVASDRNGEIVRSVEITLAHVNDGQMLGAVLPDTPGEVYADLAYAGAASGMRIRAAGDRPCLPAQSVWSEEAACTWSETPGIGDDRRIAGAMRLSAAG